MELQPDIIKLDRVLVKDCDQDHRRLAILSAMITLGGEMGIQVVVEGVERVGELEALRRVGARFVQGFYFAKPQLERLSSDAAIFAN